MNHDYVPLATLARELDMDRSHARRYVLDRGYHFTRIRTRDSRGQLTLALTRENADAVVTQRAREGFGPRARPLDDDGTGTFYVMAVAPELDPGRLKLGFATSLARRLRDHRCVAPTAEVIGSWPCRRAWEAAVLASLASFRGCTPLSPEVINCESVDGLLIRGDALFSLLPPV